MKIMSFNFSELKTMDLAWTISRNSNA